MLKTTYFKTVTFALALVVSVNLQAQSWEIQQEIPSGIFQDIQIIEGTNYVYAIQAFGTSTEPNTYFVKSEDNGDTFKAVDSPFSNLVALSDMDFLDENNGWLAGTGGAIYHTTDGGTTWTQQASGTTRNISVIDFVDANTGYASGDGYGYASTLLLKTTDGGNTWDDISFSSINCEKVKSMYFINENVGFIGSYIFGNLTGEWEGAQAMLRTLDGGMTWTDLSTPLDDLHINIESIEFVGENIGYAMASSFYVPGTVLKTMDGGDTWFTILVINGGISKYCFLAVKDVDNVAVIGSDSYGPPSLFVSSNGGNTFADTPINYSSNMWTIDYKDDHIFIAGRYGVIIRTNEEGEEQTYSHLAPEILSMDWADEYNGIAVFGALGRTAFGAYTTSNGGNSWEASLDIPGGNHVQSLDTMNTIILETGSTGKLWRTEDGGTSWNSFTPGGSAFKQEAFFVSPLVGWVAGNQDYLKKTTNGGITWTDQSMPSFPYGRATSELIFLDENTGFFSGGLGDPPGYGGFILYTTDSGATWIDGTLPNDSRIVDIDFLDAEIGYAINANKEMLKTVDGGLNWTLTSYSMPFSPVEIYATGADTVMYVDIDDAPFADNRGRLYMSTDGGDTFMEQYEGELPRTSFSGMSFQNEDRVWLYGQNASLILKSSADIILGIDDTAKNENDIYVYPNPFTDELNFKIDGHVNQEIKLELYTSTGHLISSEKITNTNSEENLITVSPARLASGIYIYVVTIDGAQAKSGKITRL